MSGENITKRVAGWPGRMVSYIQELQTEMKRVTWPNARQVRSNTVVVLFTVFAFAGFFAIVDMFLGRAISKVFDAFTK